jgi:hypothetical protein
MTKHLFSAGIVGLAALTFTAACGSTSTGPTPATTAVSSVALTSTVMSTSVLQMKATASMSDGSLRDVTAASTWSTSNAGVAVVSPTGTVTVLTNGEVDVRATYQSVTGSIKLALAKKFVLSGLVSEGLPAQGPIANARVTITSGPDSGQTMLTSANGVFRFSTATSGVLSMDVTKDGYLLWRVTDLILDRDREIDLQLYPTPPLNPAGATATARCGDGSWSWAPTRGEACTENGGVIYGVCPGPLCDGR